MLTLSNYIDSPLLLHTEMYGGYFDEQIAKQARTAISRAVSAGKRNMEVQFPSVPNVEEAKFGTPLNKKFGEKGRSFPYLYAG